MPDAPGAAATRSALEDLAGRPRSIGRYKALQELGRGGMGTVYLAELEGDGFRQRVAIKVLETSAFPARDPTSGLSTAPAALRSRLAGLSGPIRRDTTGHRRVRPRAPHAG